MSGPRRRGRGRPRHSSGRALAGARPLDRRSKVPLHYQLGEILKERLEAGVFEPGALFASERELEERFGVSRSVVRQALSLLVADGEIRRVQGSGTFVAERKHRVPVCGFLKALLDPPDPDLRLGVLSVTGHAEDARVAEYLGLPDPGSELLQITAVQHVGEPVCLVDSYFSPADLPWLAAFAEALAAGVTPPRHPAVRLREAGISVEVSALGPWTAALLDVPAGGSALVAGLLQFGLTGRAKRSRPLEFARLIYRGDRARLAVEPAPT
jgi:GntR family transcriptional regulator